MKRALSIAILLVAPIAHAQSSELPWAAFAPRLEGAHVRAAALAMPDARIGRFEPRRASARTSARERAISEIHAWADDALARVRADPRQASATHAVIDRNAEVAAVRPLIDGGAVVVVAVPAADLRRACGIRGLPWVR
jgi:hypothetical protein